MAKEKQKNTQRLTLEVENFGPIGKAKVDFRPLTIFVGRSNTGKTYLAKLVYALQRGLVAQRIITPGFDESKEKTINEIAEFVKNNQPEKAREPIREMLKYVAKYLRPYHHLLDKDLDSRIAKSFAKLGQNPRNKKQNPITYIYKCFGAEKTLNELISHSSKHGTIKLANKEMDQLRFSAELGFDRNSPLPTYKTQFGVTENAIDESYGEMKKLVDSRKQNITNNPHFTPPPYSLAFAPVLVDGYLRQMLPNWVYLPSGRGGIMESRKALVASIIESTTEGESGNQNGPRLSLTIADFLKMLNLDNNNPEILQEKLVKNLEDEILDGRIEVKRNLAGFPDFYYRAKGSTKSVSLLKTSSMVSELAPLHILLTQTKFGAEGDVLIFDEPEAHLHPALQKNIARWIAYMVKAGIKCVVTTHSDTFLEQIANLVQMSKIPDGEDKKRRAKNNPVLNEEDVGVWLFKQKASNKLTEIKEISIDKESGEYPAGYDEIFADLYNEGSRILEKIPE